MKSLKHLNKYFFRYKTRLLLGVCFVTISNVFAIFPAQIIRHAFDLVAETLRLYPLFNGFPQQEQVYDTIVLNVFIFASAVLLMALLRGIFMFFMRQTIIVMSRYVEYDLKNEVFQHYQKLSLSFYRRNNTGDLMARISEDVSRVRMYVGPAVMYTINLVVLFVLVIITMISVNPQLTLYVLLPLPLLSLSVYYVSSIINERSERVQNRLSALSTYVQEAFSGIRILQSFVREKDAASTFEKESEFYKKESMDLVKINGFFSPLMLLLIGLSTLLTVYIGGREAIKGTITTGNIAEFIIYVNMLTWPVASVGWVTSLIQRAAASQERINEFLKTEPEIFSPRVDKMELTGKIEFRNVSFTYPDSGIKALSNVSFCVEPGKSLAILGRTGSGKSTVAALITRMYDASEGMILLDDRDIKSHDLDNLRSQTGYVPQDVFLFSDTIANNISFGLASCGEHEKEMKIKQAARDAAVYSNIMEFPDGFNTRIGERGITLSGGQKQRVSIARAIIRQPKILLFDDCLSAVDTKTEEEILTSLSKIMKGKTSIIISHRVSSAKNADHIIVLENGKLEEEGTHQSLLTKRGIYCELNEKQLLENSINN